MRNRARTIIAAACGAILASPLAVLSQEQTQAQDNTPAQYVGVRGCASCHKSKATGNQIAAWQATAHAQAFDVLTSDQAGQIASKLGLKDDPQRAPQCLSCHTTGAGQMKSRFTEDFDVTEGVQCEACHGPGSKYANIQHMIKPSQAREIGLVEPNAALCKKCHNAESPTFKGFDFATAVKKIAHPLSMK